MNILRVLILILIITNNFSIQAQTDIKASNEIGLSFSTFEKNSETIHYELERKLVAGFYYNRSFSNWSWVTNMEFGKNQIKDSCHVCFDSYLGTGDMSEFIASTGIRYTFFKNRNFKIKPLIESDLYFSSIRYSGKFQGGYWGQGIIFDKTSNMIGLLGRVGLSYFPASKIALTISSSCRMGKGEIYDHYKNSSRKSLSAAITLLQFKCGYLF